MIKKITLLLLMISGTLLYGQNNCWLKMVAGSSHVIAIVQDGTPWSWNDLGLGDLNNRFVPTQIDTDSDWTNAKSGLYFGAAIKTSGEII